MLVMSAHDRRSFDRGFALVYPRDRGLDERIVDGGRTIVEPLQDMTDISDRLRSAQFPLFPSSLESTVRLHHVPTDARDLTSIIRLGRPGTLEQVGQILGNRLMTILDITQQIPTDCVLPRFAVTNTASPDTDGGIDILLVPPYDRFSPANSSSPDYLMTMIEVDLTEIPTTDFQVEAFIGGVERGLAAA